MIRINNNNLNKSCLWFYKINIFLVIASLLFNVRIVGFTMMGYLWVLMLIYSSIIIILNGTIKFPYLIWLPFFLYFTVRLVMDFSFLGLQQTLQYFAPIIAGMAASGFIYTRETLYRILKYFRRFGVFLILYTIIYPFALGKDFGAGAQLVMTVTLTVTILFSAYLFNRDMKDVVLSILLLLVPFLSTLRMGMLMTLIVIPLNFAHMGFRLRVVTSALIVMLGLLIFASPAFQRKMFFSGAGTIRDISFDNPDFYTSGRKTLYSLLEEGLKEHPIFGNGPRADLQEFKKAGLLLKETHNDYKAIRYNYGLVGLVVLMIGFLTTFLKIYRRRSAISTSSILKLYWSIALTLFIPFFGYMYTDNILKYTIFFGTLHFAFAAIVFARFRDTSPGTNNLQNSGKFEPMNHTRT